MIQWNKETLENPDSVAQILALADAEWNSRRELYERIRRKPNYSEIVSKDDNKIKVGFENYINSMVSGYFAGKAPVYDVEVVSDLEKLNIIKKVLNKVFSIDKNKDEELKVLIDYISKYNDDGAEFFAYSYGFMFPRYGKSLCKEENLRVCLVCDTYEQILREFGDFNYESLVGSKAFGDLDDFLKKVS